MNGISQRGLSTEGSVAQTQARIPMESYPVPEFITPSKPKDCPTIYTLPSLHTIMEGKSKGYWNMETNV